jgi:hypothetical protein
MASIASLAEASARQRTVDVHGQSYVLREFVGAAPFRGTYVEGSEATDDRRPQGFLVSQPAPAPRRCVHVQAGWPRFDHATAAGA